MGQDGRCGGTARVLGVLALALAAVACSRTPSTSPLPTHSVPVCSSDVCLGGSPLRVAGPPVPFVWTLPPDFYQQYKAGSSYEDVTVGTADNSAGFIFIENVGAADPKDFTRSPPDPPPPGAKALADWLGTRSYLRTTPPRQTSVGGQPAWELYARIGTIPRGATLMGRDRVPGVYLLRLLPPQHDTDAMSAWFDSTYTSPLHLWLIDLPNGMVGYVEDGDAEGPREADIAKTLSTMRFQPTSSSQ
jgi:hypothetical protein